MTLTIGRIVVATSLLTKWESLGFMQLLQQGSSLVPTDTNSE